MKFIAIPLVCFFAATMPPDEQVEQDKKGPAQAPVYDRDELAQRIDELARFAVEKEGLPGLTIAVAEADEVFFAKGYGYADAEHAQAAKDTTRYPIGTLTRQFTSVAILQLVDAEKIKLTDGLEAYLPEFPLAGRKVTIEQLLANTSGIPGFSKLAGRTDRAGSPGKKPEDKAPDVPKGKKDEGESKGLAQKQDKKPADEPTPKTGTAKTAPSADADLEKAFFAQFKDVPFDFEPGSDFSLDSSGYALLSIVVSRVAKLPYTQYVKEKILEPVGMTETQFCRRGETAFGFARDCAGAASDEDLELPIAEAGELYTQSLCASARDLVKWQQALLSRSVCSEQGSRRIMAPTTLADGNSTNFGYAIQMSKLNDFKNYAYTGVGAGYRTRLSYWSLPKVTIVVMANCDAAPVERIERDIARFVLSVPLPPNEEMKLSPEDAARCVGMYQIATTQYRIVERDGQLWFTPPVQTATRLRHRGELVFAFETDRDVTVKFTACEDGKCAGFTLYRGGFENQAKRMD